MMNLFEVMCCVRLEVTFIFMSINKVYGDMLNFLLFEDCGERFELFEDHCYFGGIDMLMLIDGSMHLLFGVFKVVADLMV